MLYLDANNEEYREGDIVYNPFFGDYWVVQSVTDEEKEEFELNTDLCLALYNDKDHYCTDIDVPTGFIILMRKNDKGYDGVLDEMKLYLEKINKEMEDNNGIEE